ncbi:cysteine desulfurase NifS [Fusobacterium sp. PH5-44]|uniref:cysteine desulfurase NifS n=1 Tax=unclassified Fusobacterium TaxID=2648384 RepID=UPI003D2621CA
MKVYLDNNATTKLDREVFEAMIPYMTEYYGNASSLHLFSKETTTAMNDSREKIANILGVSPEEIIFTGSGSEADNIAIRSIAKAYKNRGKHIITSSIEHPAVQNTLKDLADDGYDVTFVPVDKNALIDLEVLKKSIREDTILITVMHANNEVGTFQPIEEIAKIAKENKVIFHTDAVQTTGKIEIKPKELGVDLLSFSGHKFYGPKGVGVLYWRNGVRFSNVLTGGNQEKHRRPGTSDVASMVGISKALEMATQNMKEEFTKEEELRDYFEAEVLKHIPEVVVNARGVKRLSGTSSITFKYLEGESILLSLSMKGIAVSSGSACSSDELQASHVLLAMGISPEVAHGTIRFSLGKYNTKEEIDYTIESLVEIIERLRNMSPLWMEYKG